MKAWICRFCPEPCYVKIRECEGQPRACLFGLDNFRWDEDDAKLAAIEYIREQEPKNEHN